MKKIAVVVATLMLSSAAFGQKADGYGIPTNSINIQASDGLGETFMAGLVMAFAQTARAIFKQDPNEETTGWMPYLTAGYDYHFADTRWAIGGEAGYWNIGVRNKETGVTSYSHVATLAAASKIFYKPGGSFKLYGGINLGVGVASGNGDNSFFPAFQINPIGMRLGSERIAFVLELGVGYRGLIQAGINVGL
ncbi:MAG: hypothetical protein IKX60_01075 [Bacteroidales bacterium]|nr:hypothetical protein [Bacteroidales bacterium]